jgi:hypothetical protein
VAQCCQLSKLDTQGLGSVTNHINHRERAEHGYVAACRYEERQHGPLALNLYVAACAITSFQGDLPESVGQGRENMFLEYHSKTHRQFYKTCHVDDRLRILKHLFGILGTIALQGLRTPVG